MKERSDRIILSISGEADYKIVGRASPPISVIVKEISKSGLRFVTSEVIPPDSHLQLTIKITSFSKPICAEGKVIWQRRLSSRYLLETCVNFVCINNENSDRLVQYIYEFSSSSAVSREHVRCSLITDVKVCFEDNPNKEENYLSADICVKGMKLFVARSIDVDKLIDLRFFLPDDKEVTLELKGRIAWRKDLGETKVVGVEFIDLDQNGHQRIIKYVEGKLLKSS